MSTPDQPTTARQVPPAQQEAAPPIDVRKLADKVYRLLLNDLRLERARGAPPSSRKR